MISKSELKAHCCGNPCSSLAPRGVSLARWKEDLESDIRRGFYSDDKDQRGNGGYEVIDESSSVIDIT